MTTVLGYRYAYDADKNYIGTFNLNSVPTPSNCHYIKFRLTSAYGTTYNHDICINLAWDNSRNGEYEPYELHSYPLDSDLTLRGIPKLDSSNNLYYDGDVYESDGTVTRKYNVITFDGSNDETWNYLSDYHCMVSGNVADIITGVAPVPLTNNSGRFNIKRASRDGKSIQIGDSSTPIEAVASDTSTWRTWLASNPLTILYELATPTTESADPYTSPQIVDDFGTEEFILASGTFPVPVGHNTDYPINVLSKVEMMPNSPNGNGDYIVRQTSGENEYISLSSATVIQNIISRLEALEG